MDGPERCSLADRAPFRQQINTSQNLVLTEPRPIGPLTPVPRWPGDHRPDQRGRQRLLDSGYRPLPERTEAVSQTNGIGAKQQRLGEPA